MELRIAEEEERHLVSARRLESGSWQIGVCGEEKTVRWRRLDRHRLWIEIGGRARVAHIASIGSKKQIFVAGQTFLLEDSSSIPAPKRGEHGSDSGAIVPPTPAVVSRVLVRQGDPVRKGDAVIVLSAMKMETTLRAHCDGEIAAVHVAEGARVSPGEVLVELRGRRSSIPL